MSKRNTLDMTQGPVLQKLLLFAYPLILNSFISSLYNAVDKAIAGQFIGPSAMAAVGASTSIVNLFTNLSAGAAAGVSILCGNYIGAKREKDLRQAIHTAPIAGFLAGALMGLIGCLLCGPILHATDVPGDIFGDAKIYMTIYMMGLPISVADYFCINLFNAHGDTKRITIIGISSGLLNVIGNIFFIIIIPLGVAGIALATVLSQAVALTIKLSIMFNPKDNYGITLNELKLHWAHAKKMFTIGLPAGLTSAAFNFANVILQSSVNTFGSTIIAGNSAADSLASFVNPITFQMGASMGCAVAQCHGARNYRRIDEILKKGLLGSLVMVTILCSVMTVFRYPLMSLFTDDHAVAVAGMPKLLFCLWANIPYAFYQCFVGGLKGLQKTSAMMLMSVLGICLPRLLWVWFVFPFFATPTILYLIMPLSDIISAVLLAFAYRHHRKKLA